MAYCCSTMKNAVENWGGVYWDKEKQTWMAERFVRVGKSGVREIEFCLWCHKPLEPIEETNIECNQEYPTSD